MQEPDGGGAARESESVGLYVNDWWEIKLAEILLGNDTTRSKTGDEESSEAGKQGRRYFRDGTARPVGRPDDASAWCEAEEKEEERGALGCIDAKILIAPSAPPVANTVGVTGELATQSDASE